jgi:hypothetical protein
MSPEAAALVNNEQLHNLIQEFGTRPGPAGPQADGDGAHCGRDLGGAAEAVED